MAANKISPDPKLEKQCWLNYAMQALFLPSDEMPQRGTKLHSIPLAMRDLRGFLAQTSAQSRPQMRGQTRLLKALSHGGWKPSRLGNGTTFLGSNPAPWLSSLKIKIFLKSSLNKSCFRCCLSHSHQRHHCEELIPIPLIHSYMYWSAVRPIKASSAPIEPVLALWPFLTG